MFKKSVIVSAAALAACASIFLGCADDSSAVTRYRRTDYVFGTMSTLALYDDFSTEEAKSRAESVGADVSASIYNYENAFSTTIESSDIYRFNAADPGETVRVQSFTYELLQTAVSMYNETEGYYNPGIYYSVDLYGFAPREFSDSARPYDRESLDELPEDKYIQAFRTLSESFGDIRLYKDETGFYVVKPESYVTVEGDDTVYSLAIDLSGIAKGYVADKIDDYIDRVGYENGYFSFGSSSMTINGSAGSSDGLWTLTFRDPRGNSSDYYMSVRVRDIALSTSGDYENYYEVDGKRYCHIINPFTGSPIETGILTVTCLGGTAAEADARTTAISAMGLDRAIEYINSDSVKTKNLKIAFVYLNSAGEKLVVTNMEEGEYELAGEHYKLASETDENGDVVFTGEK